MKTEYEKIVKYVAELLQIGVNGGNVYCETPSANNSIDTEMGKMMQFKNQKEIDRIVQRIRSDFQEEELMKQQKKMMSLKQKIARKKKKTKILKKRNKMLQNELWDRDDELKEMSNEIYKLKKENKQLRKKMKSHLILKSSPYRIPIRKEEIVDVSCVDLEEMDR